MVNLKFSDMVIVSMGFSSDLDVLVNYPCGWRNPFFISNFYYFVTTCNLKAGLTSADHRMSAFYYPEVPPHNKPFVVKNEDMDGMFDY
jgi:hypothetical protein